MSTLLAVRPSVKWGGLLWGVGQLSLLPIPGSYPTLSVGYF